MAVYNPDTDPLKGIRYDLNMQNEPALTGNGVALASNGKEPTPLNAPVETPQSEVTTETPTVEEPVKNTGAGIESALGTEYSWDTKAKERADLAYQSDVLNTKQQFLTNRQEIEVQGQQAQQEFAMKEYSQNQSSEKAGWTGGYILDTERQMNYLKQTIQSQMYGQMELQKYGYDTSLAAARLAYDTNKYDLALEYYNTALSRAVTEAEITGYYVSPEAQEMLDQYHLATKNIEEGVDIERAQRIKDSIDKWFESNGISKQGIETIVHREFILNIKAAARQAANFDDDTLFKIDIDSFGEVDENGELQYSEDGATVKTIHFNKLSTEAIVEYANRSDIAKQQVMGYLDSLIEKDINGYLESVKKTEGDKTTYDVTEEGFKNYIARNSLITVMNLYNESPETFKDYKIETSIQNKPLYLSVIDGKLTLTINYQKQSTGTSTEPEGDIGLDLGTNPYDNLQIDGLPATVDALKKVAYTDVKVYGLNESTGVYDKFLYYNTANIDKVAEFLKNSGQYRDINASDTFDITKPKSEWGNKIEQQDFNANKSKGKAGAYIDKLIEDAKAGKIPAGQEVRFNYGECAWDAYIYVHIGNGIFIKGYKSNWNYDYYIPEGYKKDGIDIKKK